LECKFVKKLFFFIANNTLLSQFLEPISERIRTEQLVQFFIQSKRFYDVMRIWSRF